MYKKISEQTLTTPGAWLLGEMAKRQKRNPHFSLRAMANLLQVSSGCLSELISGRRAFTSNMALKFAEQLNLSPDEKLQLLSNVQTNKPSARRSAKIDTQTQISFLEVDRFRMISDWYHHAILSLCRVKNAAASPQWISQRLGISRSDATDAVERLQRMGMLTIKNGRMQQATPHHQVDTPTPAAAIRKFHTQTLQKAEESLHRHTMHERHFTTLTVAVNSSQITKAKRAIDQFCWEMDKILESPGDGNDRVYNLAVQLFPIDEPEIGDGIVDENNVVHNHNGGTKS